MTDQTQNPEGGNEAAPGLNPAEQAAIAAAQTGFTQPDPMNPTPPANEGVPQRPDNVPEKFWDAEKGAINHEALLQSYTELERAQSQAAPADDSAAAPARADGKVTKPEPAAAPEGGEGEPGPTPLQAAMEAARTQFAETQELNDDSYAALEAAGVDRATVDLFISGLRAQHQADLNAIHGYVGGEDTYNEMVTWAGANLNDAEIDAFNAALDNPALRENAVRGLHARFSGARPNEGKTVTTNNVQSQAGDVYNTIDDLTKAQSDDRYSTDPAYRQQVTEKLQRTIASGKQLMPSSMFERQIATY